MQNTRELTWKVFVADGQSSATLSPVSGKPRTGGGGEQGKKFFEHRSLSNAYNWIVRIPRKKSSSAVCLHIESTFKYHCGGYSYIHAYNIYILLYFILYIRVRLHLHKLAPCPANTNTARVRGGVLLNYSQRLSGRTCLFVRRP